MRIKLKTMLDSDSKKIIVDAVKNLIKHPDDRISIDESSMTLYRRCPLSMMNNFLGIFLNPENVSAEYMELKFTDDVSEFVDRYFETE